MPFFSSNLDSSVVISKVSFFLVLPIIPILKTYASNSICCHSWSFLQSMECEYNIRWRVKESNIEKHETRCKMNDTYFIHHESFYLWQNCGKRGKTLNRLASAFYIFSSAEPPNAGLGSPRQAQTRHPDYPF